MIPLALVLLGVLWDFDRTAPGTDFLVIYESLEPRTGVQRVLAAGVTTGTCTELPTGDADDFCTTVSCQGPGTFRLTVEARAYQTRSETITFRILDSACTRFEGVTVGAGSFARIPAGQHCQAPTPVPVPPVATTLPGQQTVTVPAKVPHTTTTAVPANPQVVPKRPHAPGTTAPPQSGTVARTPTAVPEVLTRLVRTGPPTTTTTAPPTLERPGVPCP